MTDTIARGPHPHCAAALPAVDPDRPIGLVLTEAGEQVAAERMVTIRLSGIPISIPCPSWCCVDHDSHVGDVHSLEDVYHTSEDLTVLAPHGVSGEAEHVLHAFITCYPYAEQESDRAPYFALDAANDGDGAELTGVEALAFCDQLVAHAALLRQMAHGLVEGRYGR